MTRARVRDAVSALKGSSAFKITQPPGPIASANMPFSFAIASREPCCTYLVGYEGDAADLNGWLAHYLGKHIAHMTSLPDLRELEVYTRLDWISALPFRRVNFMQRNKVAFDSEAALTQALHSPARHKMREDFRGFPPFSGRNTHHAMMTRVLQPS